MCVVSMVGDWYRDRITDPYWKPLGPYIPTTSPYETTIVNPVTREELDQFKKDLGDKFEELKKMMEEAKELLLRAKEYDEKNNEPNCEMEDKVAILKKLAELVGVDLSQVFGSTTTGTAGVYGKLVSGSSINPRGLFSTRYNTGHSE